MIRQRFAENKKFLLFGVLLFLIQLAPLIRVLTSNDTPIIDGDAAFYQHAGWYVWEGGIPYETIWDPKTPFNFVFTAILGFLFQDSMLLAHYLNIFVGSIVTASICLVISLIMYNLSENFRASIIAGLIPALMPTYHFLFALGYRPKYMFLLFGLLGILLSLKKRPFLGLLFATASAGFWQFGVLFMASSLSIFAQKSILRENIKQLLLGFTIPTLIALSLPFIWGGGFESMLINTVFAPFMSGTDSSSFLLKGGIILRSLRYASIIIPIAVIGIVSMSVDSIRSNSYDHLWMYILIVGFSVQVAFIDLDSVVDFLPLYVMLSFPVAYLYIQMNENCDYRLDNVISLLICLLLIFTVLFGAGTGTVFQKYPVTEETTNDTLWRNSLISLGEIFVGDIDLDSKIFNYRDDIPKENRRSYMDDIYWDTIKPDSCHYRVGQMHKSWIESTNQSYNSEKCLNDLGKFLSNFVI